MSTGFQRVKSDLNKSEKNTEKIHKQLIALSVEIGNKRDLLSKLDNFGPSCILSSEIKCPMTKPQINKLKKETEKEINQIEQQYNDLKVNYKNFEDSG